MFLEIFYVTLKKSQILFIMKRIKLLMALAMTALIFTACQNEGTTAYDEPNTDQISTSDIVKDSQVDNAAVEGDFVLEGDVVKVNDQEYQLDYHPKYGEVPANKYPMDPQGLTEPTLDTFLERSGINEEEIANFSIERDRFSGIGLAQHRMPDGNVIEVAHRFENEPIYRFQGELRDGTSFRIIIIIICSNGLIIIIIF